MVDEINVSRGFQDIVLGADARLLIDGIIEERHRSEELRRHRLPLSTRLLFSGPPGCGKTLCAEVVARELSLPLYCARIDVIISSFLGETASNLRRMFEFAARKPCILFLDEFDALARTRSDTAEHNELRRVVNSLLLMIERFKGPGLVIAVTNLPQFLDEALWRRFDEIISFDPPTEREIAMMLARQFANFPAHFDLEVAGIAAFGDVRECVQRQSFESPVRIISVKVVNDQGQFDDDETIPDQMEKASRAFHSRGCRIINISLGDKHRIPYDGGRVSSWAATLDAMARELDVVIVVAAGNFANAERAPWGAQSEQITQTYPAYLLSPTNRIVEPATAAIALTVGSLAHANGLPAEPVGAELRTIASLNTPSPITRSGPGANRAI